MATAFQSAVLNDNSDNASLMKRIYAINEEDDLEDLRGEERVFEK